MKRPVIKFTIKYDIQQNKNRYVINKTTTFSLIQKQVDLLLSIKKNGFIEFRNSLFRLRDNSVENNTEKDNKNLLELAMAEELREFGLLEEDIEAYHLTLSLTDDAEIFLTQLKNKSDKTT